MKRVGFLVATLALAGCGGSDGTFVHLAIARDGASTAISKIDLSLLLGGKPAATTLSEPGGGAITFPTSVTLSIGKGEGTLDVTAIGRDASGAEVGRDESTTTVKLDSTSSLTLTLHAGVAAGDMAAPADLSDADLAGADLAAPAGSDMTAPLPNPDLALTPPPDMTGPPSDMTGPPSDLTNAPMTPPSAPQSVAAKAGDSSATVTWSAPASTGGSPISYYVVNASPGGASAQTPDGNTLHATVTGLNNGGGYTFTVVAFNSVGNSAASTATAVVIPFGLPNAPTGVTAQALTAKTAFVQWTAPTNNNGSAIQSYLVTPSPATVTPVQVASGTQVSIANLTANTAYTFSVSAQNGAGAGPPSASSSSITVGDVPSVPQSVNAVRQADGSVVVSWAAPSSTNSYPINAYRIQLEAGGALYDTNQATGLSFIHTPPNIATGQAYFFYVSAENAMGYSSNASSPTLTYQPPPVPTTPTGLAVYGNSGTACLSWNAVSTASSYVLYYSTTSGIVSSGGGNSRTFAPGSGAAIDGLPTTGTIYFAIKAVNSSGSSAISAEVAEANKACNEI